MEDETLAEAAFTVTYEANGINLESQSDHGKTLSTRPRLPGQNYQHWQRQIKADAKFLQEGQVPRPKTLKTLVPLAVKSANHTELNCFQLPATNGAYGAKIAQEAVQKQSFTLDEVKSLGMTVFEWNGV